MKAQLLTIAFVLGGEPYEFPYCRTSERETNENELLFLALRFLIEKHEKYYRTPFLARWIKDLRIAKREVI
jgi:hypothetical protein